jgi:hypothetical protein
MVLFVKPPVARTAAPETKETPRSAMHPWNTRKRSMAKCGRTRTILGCPCLTCESEAWLVRGGGIGSESEKKIQVLELRCS